MADRSLSSQSDWESVHTCHAGCPCQTGGEPTPDFLPIENGILRFGWAGYLEHLIAQREQNQTEDDNA